MNIRKKFKNFLEQEQEKVHSEVLNVHELFRRAEDHAVAEFRDLVA